MKKIAIIAILVVLGIIFWNIGGTDGKDFDFKILKKDKDIKELIEDGALKDDVDSDTGDKSSNIDNSDKDQSKWTEYADADYGFSIKYPSSTGFEVNPSDANAAALKTIKFDTGITIVVRSNEDFSLRYPSRGFLTFRNQEWFIESEQSELSSVCDFNYITDFTSKNIPVVTFKFIDPYVSVNSYFVDTKDNVIQISDLNGRSDNQELGKKIVNSFEIDDVSTVKDIKCNYRL